MKSNSISKELQITLPDGLKRNFSLDKPTTTIGRSSQNDLVIDNPSLSRQHARIILADDQVLIEDLGSSNGIFMDGRRLPPHQPVPIRKSSSIQLGNIHLQVYPETKTGIYLRRVALLLIGIIAIALLVYGVYRYFPSLAPNNQPPQSSSVFNCEEETMTVLTKGGDVYHVGAGQLTPTLTTAQKAFLAPATSISGQDESPVPSPVQPLAITPGAVVTLPATPVLLASPGTISADSPPTVKQDAPEAAPQTREAGGSPLPSAPITPAEVLPTAPAGRPIVSSAFLDLPFPYDGGNENFGGTVDQFKQSSQRTGSGGRINSFFDHYLPLYPAPKDPDLPGGQEPAEPPIGRHILTFSGNLSNQDDYSGHPAYDYAPYERGKPTTPLFAAADGVIDKVGEHGSSGALFVKIRHTVPDVGDFVTIYWHMHPDEFFENMLGREGQPITAGTRIGTIGNTGWSTGHHLHFEVRFDRNRDGFFSQGEVVDPYGYIPSPEYAVDPWQDRTQLKSRYLWIHPLGVEAVIPQSGAGRLGPVSEAEGKGGAGYEEELELCAKPGSLPPGGKVFWSWSQDPAPSNFLAGSGDGCVLSVLDAQGNPVTQFDPPLTFAVPFDEADLEGLDPDKLTIYWLEYGSDDWKPLPTQIDHQNNIAVASTDRPGHCALLSQTLVDMAAPRTDIQVNGPTAPDGSYYDQVIVTLISSDPSGIQRIEYSLDAGTTWKVYTKPIVVEPSGIPQVTSLDAQFFGGLPGVTLVLARATDGAGNVENPPSYIQILINPAKAPIIEPTKTPSLTPSETPSPTQTETPSPTFTLSSCEPVFTFTMNANCRRGPGTYYDVVTSLLAGQSVAIIGQNEKTNNLWWPIQLPNSPAKCWVADSTGSVEGETSCLAFQYIPPTQTQVSPSDTPKPLTPSDTPLPVTVPPVVVTTPPVVVTTPPVVVTIPPVIVTIPPIIVLPSDTPSPTPIIIY